MKRLGLCLSSLVLALGCRTTAPVAGGSSVKDSPAAAANSGMGLKPVLVYSDSGNMDAAKRDVILSTVARAAQKSMQGVIGDASLTKATASFALFARAVKHFDDHLVAEAAAGPLHDLMVNNPDSSTVELALMMVDAGWAPPPEAALGTLAGAQAGRWRRSVASCSSRRRASTPTRSKA